MSVDDGVQRSPFTRPAFVASAILIGLVLVAGAVLLIMGWVNGDKEPEGEAEPKPAPVQTEEPAPDPESDSRCGLRDVQLEGTLNSAPELTDWAYAGNTRYPISDKHGPAETLDSGARVCFERTPEGAVFAAAALTAQLENPSTRVASAEVSMVPGELRDMHLADSTSGASETLRVTVNGFRLMSYDGSTAKVDVAATATGQGESAYIAAVKYLEWSDGDWKLAGTPADYSAGGTQLPDLAGYAVWGE